MPIHANGVLQHGLKHRLKLAWRPADHPENLGRRGLLLQGLGKIIGALAQLVEQARVLDGDDGLIGEAREQLDLLVGEWAGLLAVDHNGPDQLVVLEHRDREYGAIAAQIDAAADKWIALHVGLCRLCIVDLGRLFGSDDTPKG